MNKKIKLSDKQKEVIDALKKGCRIYQSLSGKPGNVGVYSRLRYTDGKGIGGSIPHRTIEVLVQHKIMEITSTNHKTNYTLTELGKSY